MTGFKSFAGKTKLGFEPGMTAIVGPNGCGKSNISDAIRWVIGEQSAKAMRGNKMTDCIFSGTDKRKPMGMAEVSITFADCEKELGLEYDEVTISRRVFPSGEGQYFINRTGCRLRDIQRLFMDTGIGTSSYSFMEQGRIDQILSSRPEDRRAVFEEASGITKFKADKKEAIRKLDHTEANLLRLSDVIREVKRQIGSLQRQAGKARRYKTFSDELRGLDLFVSRKRVEKADREIRGLNQQIESLGRDLGDADRETRDLETGASTLRESIVQTEREVGSAMEACMEARGKLDHTRSLIDMHQKRIEEYRAWSDRDSKEIQVTKEQVAARESEAETLRDQAADIREKHEASEQELKQCGAGFTAHQQQIDEARRQLQKLREEAVDAEGLLSKIQNQLMELESSDRAAAVQRERLAAEKHQLSRQLNDYRRRQEDMNRALAAAGQDVADSDAEMTGLETRQDALAAELKTLQAELADLQNQRAGMAARVAFLAESEESREGFAAGAALLLDKDNPLQVAPGSIMGALADNIQAEAGYETALEASLRAWLDAVLVRDTAALTDVLQTLSGRREGAAHLLACNAPAAARTFPQGARRLLDHVRCEETVRPVLDRLIGHVAVVDSLEQAPCPIPPQTGFVTPDGCFADEASAAFWMRDAHGADPLSRKHLRSQEEQGIADIETRIEEKKARAANLQQAVNDTVLRIRETRTRLDGMKRLLAQKEGEAQVIGRETEQAEQRLETVTWEIGNMDNQGQSSARERKELAERIRTEQDRRQQITASISEHNNALHALEDRHAALQAELTEVRIRHSELSQKRIHVESHQQSLESRIREMRAAIEGRAQGIESYTSSIASLQDNIAEAQEQIAALETSLSQNKARAESLRKNREQQSAELKRMEQALAARREAHEDLRSRLSRAEVQLAEANMRRENQISRVTADYKITVHDLIEAPEPAWDGEPPSMDTIETRIEELRTKIEAMGPVNLIAIEEYKELEERYAFLTAQEADLVKAKQQLMDMIRKINRTTTELFRSTFEQVNENFQAMFRRLFNGGSAKLVLVNEDDVLECGIEIIARPPGKRLQNVSLLSGGERTMTAVALLFSIYMIKPSPFCMLDELDAALDDANIGRFVAILKDFLAHSQFVVITHNRQTIAAADVLYGVTMPEFGISKLVSMKFAEHERLLEPASAN